MTGSHVAIILTHGFALVAGLIIAIGPQNLFLLRQGVQRRHLFLVATTCTLCDLLLLTLGLGGLHRFLLAYPALFRWVSWAGIFFLVYSGARAFHAAFTPAVWTDAPTLAHPPSVRSTLGTTLVVSLLNPSAYLEMVLLIGSVGSRYPLADRLVFGTGHSAPPPSGFLVWPMAPPGWPRGSAGWRLGGCSISCPAQPCG